MENHPLQPSLPALLSIRTCLLARPSIFQHVGTPLHLSSMYLLVYSSIRISFYLSDCLSFCDSYITCLSSYSRRLSVYSRRMPLHLSSMYLLVYSSIRISFYLPDCLSVCNSYVTCLSLHSRRLSVYPCCARCFFCQP